MSFLKKLGQVLAGVAGAAGTLAGLGPILTPFLGSGKAPQAAETGLNDLTAIGQIVLQIEVALAGKNGPDKLAAAIALIGPIVRTSQLVSGKKIADEMLLRTGIGEITQGTVNVLNSLHSDNVKV